MEIEPVLASQFNAALDMIRAVIEKCPDTIWDDDAHGNRFWHVAYHALYYTHLYLGPAEGCMMALWEKSRPDLHFLGSLPGAAGRVPVITQSYTRSELLEYHRIVLKDVKRGINASPLDGPSGFSWLPFSRLETHIYNIRHLQHHTGQLIDRIRTETGEGVEWVGKG